jgi:DNA polymerase gamma 1
LRWQNQPIFHDKRYGWVYYASYGTGEKLEINGQAAWRVPHKKGDDVNVGSPLAKGYIEHYENGLMSSEDEDAKVVLDEAAAVSYWTSVRERVISQKAPEINNHRWIVPQLENYGTTTRRAIEPLWLTVASAQSHKVGSELKGMVRPPEGYAFVSADFTA